MGKFTETEKIFQVIILGVSNLPLLHETGFQASFTTDPTTLTFDQNRSTDPPRRIEKFTKT